ncbi:phage head-tail connector protein [Clostridioides difficile]|nr:phage head-tail connector protein [Clostridioides difficile]
MADNDMKADVLEALLKRPGFTDKTELLTEMIADSIVDIRNFLNYGDTEELPAGCITAVKELTLVRFNQDGAEGLKSESQSSGGSESYMDDLPNKVKRTIRKYRRLPR